MSKIGACGDDCLFCLRYKATISNNKEELERVKKLWVALGWREPDFDVEKMKCSGCSKENINCGCPELRDCVFSKGLKNCGLCSSYPCELTKTVFEKAEKAFCSLKQVGTKEEMDSLVKAFRDKKKKLDKINIFQKILFSVAVAAIIFLFIFGRHFLVFK